MRKKNKKVAENADKEAAVTMATDQKNLISKADDLKPEVPVEEETEKNLMVNSGSDSFVLAKAKKPVNEASMSRESDKTQELSCVVQV